MEPTTLYNGEVEILFNPGNHRYTVNGEYKPGVTSILSVINKPLLLNWSAHMASEAFKEAVARRIGEGGQITDAWLKRTAEACKTAHTSYSDKAKDLGHIVHEAIEQYLRFGTVPLLPERKAQRLVERFIEHFNASDYEVVGVEQVIYSRQYDYAGTYDIKLRHTTTGELVIADIKTTKRSYQNQQGIYLEYPAQLGGYAIADEEETGDTIADLLIINPDKEYEEVQWVSMKSLGISVTDAKQTFLEVLKLHKALKPVEFSLKQQNTLKKGLWYAKEKAVEV